MSLLKNYNYFICFVIIQFILSSCNDEERIDVQSSDEIIQLESVAFDLEKFMQEESEISDQGSAGARLISSGSFSSRYDASGQIETKVWYSTYSNEQHHANKSATVGSGYVCVGGGAKVNYNGNGGLLTASYPSTNKETWYASSKDHGWADSHSLTVYAIGMKISGITEAQLKSYISINSSTSTSSQYPYKQQNGIADRELLSGGARVNWSGDGNLLVRSEPIAISWYCRSKDHGWLSPATITAYNVSILRNIPNFGSVDSQTFRGIVSSPSSGSHSVSISVSSEGYAQTGIGGASMSPSGESFANTGPGRLLYGLVPTGSNATSYSKDHGWVDNDRTYVYSVGLKKL